MDYSRQSLAWTRSVRFRSASLAARGAWTMLNGYCADQKNGGRLEKAKRWNDVQWDKCMDCSRAVIAEVVDAELASWDGEDLVLGGYDADGESSHTFKSVRGANGAQARWAKEGTKADLAAALEECNCAADAAAVTEWRAALNGYGIRTLTDARSFLTFAASTCSPLRYARHVNDITVSEWRRKGTA